MQTTVRVIEIEIVGATVQEMEEHAHSYAQQNDMEILSSRVKDPAHAYPRLVVTYLNPRIEWLSLEEPDEKRPLMPSKGQE